MIISNNANKWPLKYLHSQNKCFHVLLKSYKRTLSSATQVPYGRSQSIYWVVASRATALSIWAGRALHTALCWGGEQAVNSSQWQGAVSVFEAKKHCTGWQRLWWPPARFPKYLGLLGLCLLNLLVGSQLACCLQLLKSSWWPSNLYLQIRVASPLLECPAFLLNSSYPHSNLCFSQFTIWAGSSSSHILCLNPFMWMLLMTFNDKKITTIWGSQLRF